jgi:hypothetical protein
VCISADPLKGPINLPGDQGVGALPISRRGHQWMSGLIPLIHA